MIFWQYFVRYIVQAWSLWLLAGWQRSSNGAPVNTFDIDLVDSRNDTNIARLLQVLEGLDAVYRIQLERRIRPCASHRPSAGHNLLTRFGWLDLLGTIGRSLSYEDLLPHSVEMDVGEGIVVNVSRNAATVMVTYSTLEIYSGDYIEIE